MKKFWGINEKHYVSLSMKHTLKICWYVVTHLQNTLSFSPETTQFNLCFSSPLTFRVNKALGTKFQ